MHDHPPVLVTVDRYCTTPVVTGLTVNLVVPLRSGLLNDAAEPIATAVGDLASPVPPLSPDAACEQVRDSFVGDPGLFAVPIVNQSGDPVGLVNRFKFLERLSTPFGRELVANKPVSGFMEPNPLIVDVQTSLDELGSRLLDDGHRHVLDGFIVTRLGRYSGLGTGLDLLRALTERRHQELQRLALHDILTGLTERQLAFLEREHCDCAQGFLLGRPMPTAELAQLLKRPGPGAGGRRLPPTPLIASQKNSGTGVPL